MDDPILGVGYDAFWVPGTHEAEVLWQQFGIIERSGFHFHNLVINEFVDLGLLGLSFWVLAYLLTWLRAWRYLRKNGQYRVHLLFRHDGDVSRQSLRGGRYTCAVSFSGLFFFFVVMRVAARQFPKAATTAIEKKPLIRVVNR